eukprot:scaffold7592_cov255-Prasinococcus_capsulatus_cf.AAC.2
MPAPHCRCESPPCTGETGKRTKWPAGLLSNFFTDHFVETQARTRRSRARRCCRGSSAHGAGCCWGDVAAADDAAAAAASWGGSGQRRVLHGAQPLRGVLRGGGHRREQQRRAGRGLQRGVLQVATRSLAACSLARSLARVPCARRRLARSGS